MIELHTLKPADGARRKSRRLGRGPGSGRGKTAGRGTKGQRSRSGGRNNLKLKGIKQMILSFPKNRGFRSLTPKAVTITLDRLSKAFPKTQKVDFLALKKAGLVNKSATRAKIVKSGEIKIALQIVNIPVTKTAQEAIEKAGGSVQMDKKQKITKKTK